jgi:hypothetical protein
LGDVGCKSLERPRTIAQTDSFERAKAKRAENLAKKTKKFAPKPEPGPAPPPAPKPMTTDALAPRRKPRSDAGKRLGRMVRYDEYSTEGVIDGESPPSEPEVSSAPPPFFSVVGGLTPPYFVIV